MTNIPTEDILPDVKLRLEGEEWRFVGSNYIKNCDDTYIISSYGRLYNYKEKRLLSASPTGNYLRAHIRSHDENGKSIDNVKQLQRIMMASFFPIDNMDEYEVDHIDGCSFNNYIDNLQWLPREDNIKKDNESKYSRSALMKSNKPIYNLISQNNMLRDKLNKIKKENKENE